ncbi:MAG: hypothetical protein NUW37_06145 [Planctomycetes bacterium]|nr:hypothetical protein [Planctomycetota bacterium]
MKIWVKKVPSVIRLALLLSATAALHFQKDGSLQTAIFGILIAAELLYFFDTRHRFEETSKDSDVSLWWHLGDAIYRTMSMLMLAAISKDLGPDVREVPLWCAGFVFVNAILFSSTRMLAKMKNKPFSGGRIEFARPYLTSALVIVCLLDLFELRLGEFLPAALAIVVSAICFASAIETLVAGRKLYLRDYETGVAQ